MAFGRVHCPTFDALVKMHWGMVSEYWRNDRQDHPEIIWILTNQQCTYMIYQPYTLEPHYNTHFGVYSGISVITEQPYNEGLIHRKYKEWEPCL